MPAIAALYIPSKELTATLGGASAAKVFALLGSGDVRHASGPDVDFGRAAKVPEFPIIIPAHYFQLETSSRKGLPAAS